MTPNERLTGRRFWKGGFLVIRYPTPLPIIQVFSVYTVKVFCTVCRLLICADDVQWDTWTGTGTGNADGVTTVFLFSSHCVYEEFPPFWSRSNTRFLHSITLMRHWRPFWPVKVKRSHVAVLARHVYAKRPKGMPVICTDVTKTKTRVLK